MNDPAHARASRTYSRRTKCQPKRRSTFEGTDLPITFSQWFLSKQSRAQRHFISKHALNRPKLRLTKLLIDHNRGTRSAIDTSKNWLGQETPWPGTTRQSPAAASFRWRLFWFGNYWKSLTFDKRYRSRHTSTGNLCNHQCRSPWCSKSF